ncbi:SMC-Scp complex subunit ScpB [Limibacillus sp. MBR-115]|jgi:segregation and condensation protein B|uniref:SMC-Scp complex subunit ScpB n=1 Tax=Limibacillus sp. MBR-115 TaxID=3156465 RepID=UPI003391ED34
MTESYDHLRLLEALLFAAKDPMTVKQLQRHFPDDLDLETALVDLKARYANRGVVLQRVGEAWAFRTAQDLAPHMRIEQTVMRKLSRAAVETLAIIAYHQPLTRTEIEEIRGVAMSKGTLDVLLEAGWIRPRGRRRTPGRPVTWGTTQSFLDTFGLEAIDELPGIEELKAAGLLDKRPALTALTSRGMLTAVMDADDAEDMGERSRSRFEDTDDEFEEDELDESEVDIALAEDFGADIQTPDIGDDVDQEDDASDNEDEERESSY